MKTGKGLTGARLKWLAIFFMLVDHIGAVLLDPLTIAGITRFDVHGLLGTHAYDLYILCRLIGRTAFPIFCFLLVEGFHHTANKLKYLRNLCVFALLSEVPFNLAIGNQVFTLEYQNVFFTLALGLGAIWIADYFDGREKKGTLTPAVSHGLTVVDILGIAMLAQWANTDYGAMGVCAIYVLFALGQNKTNSAVITWVLLSLSNWLEVFCFPFVFAVKYYNGQRGRQNKYFFYVFYPAHLLLLYFIRAWLMA